MRLELKCEGKINPVCVKEKPEFSWKCILDEGEKSSYQKSYHLIVEDEEKNILWDSGVVETDKSTFIKYDGKRLESHKKYIWSLTVETDTEITGKSHASFVTGIFGNDWKAKWISAPEYKNAPKFIKKFEVDNDINSAYAYICGLGYYELYINGEKVGNDYFAPNQTHYDDVEYKNLKYPFKGNPKRVCNYLGYDVKKYLKVGENLIEIILGNGWFNQKERVIEGEFSYDSLKTIFELHYDGNIVKSDETWVAKNSNILYNNIFYGEIVDAGYSDKKEYKVKLAKAPDADFSPQFAPTDKVMEEITPNIIGNSLYDAGKCLTGFATISVKGAPGNKVEIYYAEKLDDNGNLDYTSTVGYEESDKNQIQKDVYIIGSNMEESYSPRFVWHGFRYFKIVSEGVEISDVSVKYIYTEMDVRTTFESTDELLNKIHNMYLNTQKSNTHGAVPMDCPTRERMGYTGDGQSSSLSGMYNFDGYTFYKKWFCDILMTQNMETGYVTHTAPFTGGGGGHMWGSAIAVVAWNLYKIYGDPEVLNYTDNIKMWINYLKGKRNSNGLVYKEEDGSWCLGEWVLPTGEVWSEPQFDKIKIPNELVNTSAYIYCMQIYLKMLDIKGEKDLQMEKDLATAISDFNNAYLKEYYSEGKQGCDVFPLYLDIVPEEKKEGVINNLIKNLVDNDKKLDTGLFGTGYLMQVLDKYNQNDLALELIESENYPGYGYMVKNGATALWETWEGSGSQNHTALSAFDSWIFTGISGIRPIDEKPGFKEFIIKPSFVKKITQLSATVNTDYGEIKVGWKRENNKINVNISVPFNTKAYVVMGGKKSVNTCGEYEYVLDDAE